MSAPDVWATVAPRTRPPRFFTPDEVEAFAVHWLKALDPLANFSRECAPEAVKACRVLFPGYSIAGYGLDCMRLLRERATPAQAMQALWAAPMPETRPPRYAPAPHELVTAARFKRTQVASAVLALCNTLSRHA
jgi:hypothetical protein